MRYSFFGFWSMICALALVSVAVSGCAKRADDKDEDLIDWPGLTGKGSTKIPKTEFKVKAYDGVIRGKVTFKGNPPGGGPLPALVAHKDCVVGGTEKERQDQAWLIGPGNGVENVVIFLSIPKDKYFDLPSEARERKDVVFVDQPHCAFIPHIQAAFPEYFDGKSQKFEPTGQKFEVKNSASFPHNFAYIGDPSYTGQGNELVPPGSARAVRIKYEPGGDPIKFFCGIHGFMYGRLFTFDHPFYARTDEKGEFVIQGVPTDVEVTLKAWHEIPGYFKNEKKTFKAGETRLDLEVGPK